MRSERGWAARLAISLTAVTVLATTACEEDSAVFSPLVDETPPTVSITDIQVSGDTLRITTKSEDFIGLSAVVIDLRRTDQFQTEITATGDTLILGTLITTDTTYTTGRVQEFTVTTTFLLPFTSPTLIDSSLKPKRRLRAGGASSRFHSLPSSRAGRLRLELPT